MWTEYVQTPGMAQYRVLPRMSALSEVLWSGPGKNTYEDFYSRLLSLKNRFKNLEWNYAPGSYTITIDVDQNSKLGEHKISLRSEKPGEMIRYTIDGSDPSGESMVYNDPIKVRKKTVIKASMFVDGKQKGKASEKTIFFSKATGKKVKNQVL